MPSRPTCVAVVVFWLATSGWLVYHDFLPYWRAAEPMPFAIDLADEARQSVIWRVSQNGRESGQVATKVEYNRADDTYLLVSNFTQTHEPGRRRSGPVRTVESKYRVTRDGQLLGMEAEIKIQVLAVDAVARVKGAVRDGLFAPRWEIEAAEFRKELVCEPVEVSGRGSILNPLQPFNRLAGLRPGQQWRMPLVDPLRDAADAAQAALSPFGTGSGAGVRIVSARVLDEPQPLAWEDEEEQCLVIEYAGDNMTARTWVRRRDGLVLRQEAKLQDTEMILTRRRGD